MTKFERSVIPFSEILRVREDLLQQWKSGSKLLREQFGSDEEQARIAISEAVARANNGDVWLNDAYQVTAHSSPEWVHLSIKRQDRQPIHDWRELQQIKNELVGPECEAIELYPAESRRVDSANQYHLWCVSNPEFRFPIGFDDGRMVDDESLAGSVNRPLAQKP